MKSAGSGGNRSALVFAGLGSRSLFPSRDWVAKTLAVSSLQTRVLIEDCHRLFCEEVRFALNSGILKTNSIDIETISSYDQLLSPPQASQSSAIVQHASLFLSQILKLINQRSISKSVDVAVAGFCSGLFAAAVAASTSSEAEIISVSKTYFIASLWLGIRSEEYRQRQLDAGEESQLPWSAVIENITAAEVDSALASRDGVFISARNTPNCVTISGPGSKLQSFLKNVALPEGSRIRTTDIFTLYHCRAKLTEVHQRILGDIRRRSPQIVKSPVPRFIIPLISTIDGSLTQIGQHYESFELVCDKLLEMMLLEPIDWVSLEKRIIELAKSSGDLRSSSFAIFNLGPKYGFNGSRHELPINTKVDDTYKSATPTIQAAYDPEDIAIVGMSVDLPDAPHYEKLWENIMAGLNSVKEIPGDRFKLEDFYQAKMPNGEKAPRALNTRYGCFLDNPFAFDNGLFNVSPREAMSTDPQQRLLLQVAYRALEDAGYTPDSTPSWARETFGCYVSSSSCDYFQNLREQIDTHHPTGTLRAFMSGKISFAFGWGAPSIVFDTACSASVVAMHQACRAIAAGDCRSALVGAVHVITGPDNYLGLERAHFLSPTGQCKTFDVTADGYCRADGASCFVLKKVGDAIAENDRIHAVIRGVDLNQSADSASITHPDPGSLQSLFTRLTKRSGVDPMDVTAVELHGTGTQAGDPDEVQAIRGALCEDRTMADPLHLMSLKANIGHSEPAAGLASLAKLCLMMKYEKIPPQISLKNLNPNIKPLGTDGAVISTVPVGWNRKQGAPFTAMLNCFGASGSNAAMMLQEFVKAEAPQSLRSLDAPVHPYVLGLSAKTEATLQKSREELIQMLQNNPDLSARDVAYTSTARHLIHDFRISAVGSTITELSDSLSKAKVSKVRKSTVQSAEAVFVFSGQGSAYAGMGRELMDIYPLFQQTIYECEDLLLQHGYPSCLTAIQNDSSSLETMSESPIQQGMQTAIFAIEVGLAKLLLSWGIKPTAVVGHSLGEYAALAIAEVLSVEDALLLVAERARLFLDECEPGKTSMLAINSSAGKIQREISSSSEFSKLEISCNNSPTDCVLGGPIAALESFKVHAKKSLGAKSTLLQVPVAYHTSNVDPILSKLSAKAQKVNFSRPNVPVVSNVLGRVVLPEEDIFNSDYLLQHCRQKVMFTEGIDDLLSGKLEITADRWLEIGPHPSLTPMLKNWSSLESSQISSCMRKNVHPSKLLTQLLGNFYTTSNGMNWRSVFEGESGDLSFVNLPQMPFTLRTFHIQYEELPTGRGLIEAPAQENSKQPHTFLGQLLQAPSSSNGKIAIYNTPIELLKTQVSGHLVGEEPLFPSSLYHSLALAATETAWPKDVAGNTLSVCDVSYKRPLFYSAGSGTLVQTKLIRRANTNSFSFTISALEENNGKMVHEHCSGSVKIKSKAETKSKHERMLPLIKYRRNDFAKQDDCQVLNTRAVYDLVFPRAVKYAPMFQSIRKIQVNSATTEALASCEISSECKSVDVASQHLVLMDSIAHVAGFVANMSAANGELFIASKCDSCLVKQDSSALDLPFEVHCTLFESLEGDSLVADISATNSSGILAVCKGVAFQRVRVEDVHRFGQSSPPIIKLHTPEQPKMTADSYFPPKIEVHLPENKFVTTAESPRGGPSVRQILADTVGIDVDSVEAEASLNAIGIDSILMIELEPLLTEAAGKKITRPMLLQCGSVGDVERICGATAPSSSDTEESGTSSPSSYEADTPAFDAESDPITEAVISTLAKTVGLDYQDVKYDADLDALGLNSILAIEVEDRLRKIPGVVEFSQADLASCNSVEDLVVAVSPATSRRPSAAPSLVHTPANMSRVGSVVHMGAQTPMTPAEYCLVLGDKDKSLVENVLGLGEQPEVVQASHAGVRNATPLYLIHDGSGHCLHYHRLRSLDRDVFAIHNPNFTSPEDWQDLPSMVREYADTILEATHSNPSQPILVGGWSFGGFLAFETAQVLASRGRKVQGIVLIDSPALSAHVTFPADFTTALESSGNKGKNQRLWKLITDLRTRNFMAAGRMLDKMVRQTQVTRKPSPDIVLLRSKESFIPKGWPSIPWLQDRSDASTIAAPWEKAAGKAITVTDIPGNHFAAFDQKNIESVSKALSEACKILESHN